VLIAFAMYQNLASSPVNITDTACGDLSSTQSQPPKKREHREVAEPGSGTPVAARQQLIDLIPLQRAR